MTGTLARELRNGGRIKTICVFQSRMKSRAMECEDTTIMSKAKGG